MSKQKESNNDFQYSVDNFTDSTSCLLCGGKAEFKKKQKGYQEPEIYNIYCCDLCNTAFSLPRVSDNDVYELIYKNAQIVKGYSKYQHYQEQVIKEKNPLNYLTNLEPSYWSTAHAIQNILQVGKNERILEVGSGLGYFTYSLRKAGYNIQGLDISQEAVRNANLKFGNYYISGDLVDFAEHNLESYDLVIMTEVIEHLHNPKEFVKSINKLLKPNGAFIFTTPNKSFFPNAIGWYSDAPPVHCWWFSEKSVEYIANFFNMNLKFVDFSHYYKNHPFINKIVNLDNEGEFVFDVAGNVIERKDTTHNFEMPKWLKKSKVYSYLRNSLFISLYPNTYKTGGIQSNVLCAILFKNKN